MEVKDKKPLNVESLEVTELEDVDLDDVAGGGLDPNGNCPCPINIGCPAEPHHNQH